MTAAVSAQDASQYAQRQHDGYDRLMAVAQSVPTLKVAVAHPCDAASLGAVFEAVALGLIEPILVGPQAKIRAAAEALGKDISRMRLVHAPHSQAAAEAAVDLVRSGQAEALMKRSLHTDELMGAVVRREGGLRTARRISHCFVMDVPGHDTPIIITDAAVNIMPTLEDKVHIVQNAIDLAKALRIDLARVAILSAMETVNPEVPSTIEAAALCKMADRGQITGGILDGPLAVDNAIDLGAAKMKKIESPVAGLANVLVVPDLEAGNMLAKSLTFLADADAAGIVLGARVPIILTSRADSTITRLASCAVASLVAALGGLDGLVFTGGIGENDVATCTEVITGLAWAGLTLDEAANRTVGPRISTGSGPTAWVIPTNEERVIASQTRSILETTQAKPAS